MGSLIDADKDFYSNPLKYPGWLRNTIDPNMFEGFPDVCLDINPNNPPRISRDKHELLYQLFEDADEINKREGRSLIEINNNKSGSIIGDLFGKIKNKGMKSIYLNNINNNQFKVSVLRNNANQFNLEKIKKVPESITTENLKTLFGKSNITILQDSSQITVAKLLSNHEGFTFQILHNRESFNDAHKIRVDTDTDYFDIKAEDITYAEDVNILNRDKFFSKFRLILKRPIVTERSTDFSIVYGDEVLFHTTTNETNSIFECVKLINAEEKRAHELRARDCIRVHKVHCHVKKIAAIYQVKRAGDWLMALSCFDRTRNYMNDYGVELAEIDNIILVTSDFILLWYCLLLGIDVLFTGKFSALSVVMLFSKVHHDSLNNTNPLNAIEVNTENSNNNSENSNNKRKKPRINNSEGNLMMGGGRNKIEEFVNQVIKELNIFLNDDDLDYEFYEYVGYFTLAALDEPKDTSYKRKLMAYFYYKMPSLEKTITAHDKEFIDLFEYRFFADCVSFAARNIALHTFDKPINFEAYKDKVELSEAMKNKFKTYKETNKHLTFEERQDYITIHLKKHLSELHTLNNRKKSVRKRREVRKSNSMYILSSRPRKTRKII
jgi:hypothetical protein